MQNYITSMPVGRNERETNDCTVIALHNVTGTPYAICRDIAAKAGRVMRKGMFSDDIEDDLLRVAAERGHWFVDVGLPKGSMTLQGLQWMFPKGNLYILIRGHALALVDGVIHDPTRSHMTSPVLRAWKLITPRVKPESFVESLFS